MNEIKRFFLGDRIKLYHNSQSKSWRITNINYNLGDEPIVTLRPTGIFNKFVYEVEVPLVLLESNTCLEKIHENS